MVKRFYEMTNTRYHRVKNCKKNNEGKVVSVYATKDAEGAEVQLHSFSTSASDGGEWSISRPGHFTAWK
jgi:hypothetical protein